MNTIGTNYDYDIFEYLLKKISLRKDRQFVSAIARMYFAHVPHKTEVAQWKRDLFEISDRDLKLRHDRATVGGWLAANS